MADDERLRKVVEDLIDVMHLQAKELEQLVVQVEQIAERLPGENRLSLVVSELSELKRRVQSPAGSPWDPAPLDPGLSGSVVPPL
jgi:hypothetical protein